MPRSLAAEAALIRIDGRAYHDGKGATHDDTPDCSWKTRVTWSKEGELLFPQDRTALVIEVDEWIDACGPRADARGLVGRRRAG